MGEKLPEGASFCGKCGSKVEKKNNKENVDNNGKTSINKEAVIYTSEMLGKKLFTTYLIVAFLCIIAAIVFWVIRHVMMGILRRESIYYGWMGLYEMPFSAKVLLVLGIVLAILCVLIILLALARRTSWIALYPSYIEGYAAKAFPWMKDIVFSCTYDEIRSVHCRIDRLACWGSTNIEKAKMGYIEIRCANNIYKCLSGNLKEVQRIVNEKINY